MSEHTQLKNMPLVSIVVPSFNQGNFIEKTLLSVIGQSYPNKEIMVIDGGSKDKSVEIIKKYARHLKYWVSEPDNGQAHAINKGFQKATGEYYCWLNSDDIILPSMLTESITEMQKHSESEIITYGNRLRIDQNDAIFDIDLPPSRITFSHFSICSWIPQETSVFSKKLWNKLNGLDESFQFALDYDLYVRAFLRKACFVKINSFLGAMRFHNECKSCKENMRQVQLMECNRILDRLLKKGYLDKACLFATRQIFGRLLYYYNKLKKKSKIKKECFSVLKQFF